MKFQFHFLNTALSFIFLLLMLSISSSCSDDDDGDQELFLWNQTVCADPWDAGLTDSKENITEALLSYLAENGVNEARIVNFENNESTVAICSACHCATGIVIYVETSKINGSKMEDLGFVRDLCTRFIKKSAYERSFN